MYLTSSAYRRAMREPIRESPSLARVYLGVFDRGAPEDALVSASPSVPWACTDNVIADAGVSAGYAAFEPDHFRLDGTQLLLPDDASAALPQGWVSAAPAGASGLPALDADGVLRFSPLPVLDEDGVLHLQDAVLDDTGVLTVSGTADDQPYLTVSFGQTHSMAGLTLTFGAVEEDAPQSVAVLSYRAGELLNTQTVTPDGPVTAAELLLEDVDAITLRFSPAPGRRARLAHIEFGIGYRYESRDILSITEKHTDSPVSLELPSDSLQFELRDENGRFAVDGETALVRFLAEGQTVQVDYGLQLPGGSEWVPGGKWQLSGWRTDGSAACFTAATLLEQLTKTTYEKGVYDYAWHSVYDLAAAVLADAGIDPADYDIDPALQDTGAGDPLPVVSHAAALQLLANLGRARLYMARDGRLTMRRLTVRPVWRLQAGLVPCTSWSDPDSVLSGTAAGYAAFEPGFFRLDGTQLLLPDGDGAVAGSGLTAADPGGAEQPLWYVTTSDPTDVYAVTLDFGGPAPAGIGIRAYKDGAWTDWQAFAPARRTETFDVAYQHITGLQVRITQPQQAGQRARLAAFMTDNIPDFALPAGQLYQRSGQLKPRLRNVTALMSWRMRYPGQRSDVCTARLPCNQGWLRLEHDLVLDPALTAADETVTVEAQHYAYVSYIRLTAASDGEVDVTLTGTRLTGEITRTLTSPANDTGEDLPIDNPLLDSARYAQPVLDWVRDHYSGRVQRTLEGRGFPEVDAGDVIRLDGGAPAQVTVTELTYNGAFRETFTVRGG